MTMRGEMEVFQMAIDTWGADAQERLFFEEAGELMQAISKVHRGKDTPAHIAEEIADLMITLDQLRLIYGISEEDVRRQRERKVTRLLNRLAAIQGS